MRFELEPDNRGRPDQELLDDLRAVANKIAGRSVTKEVYNQHGRFSAATIQKRFGGWNKGLQIAGLEPAREQSVTRERLIGDIYEVAISLDTNSLTQADYERRGKYSSRVIYRLFRSWDEAVSAAGFQPGWNRAITEEDLFENIERVWRHYGRQPRITEMFPPVSRYCGGTYRNRFGGWRKALEAFVKAVNEESVDEPQATPESVEPICSTRSAARVRQTARTANYRLRFLTLRRDGFRCRACGRSPATSPGVELEADHIVPWSAGGETVLDNLQTLCNTCNSGKSDLPFLEPTQEQE